MCKENGGQGSAFNAGFAASTGEAVCFLDADDMLLPTAAQRAVEIFAATRAVKVQWRLWTMDELGCRTGQVIPATDPPDGDLRPEVLRDGPTYDWNTTPPTSGNAWSRAFLEHALPMPEEPYRLDADVYLIILAPLYGTVATAPQPLACYRMHGTNNFWNRNLDESRLRDLTVRFEASCRVLAEHLSLQVVQPDVAGWKKRNFNYLWPTRLLDAKSDLARLLPETAAYILVNGDEWGGGEPVPGRVAIPFLEQEGVYAGPPVDDGQAIAELERLRRGGAWAIVFWWTVFWWFKHYPEFACHLKTRYPCLLNADHVVVFDLHKEGSVDA